MKKSIVIIFIFFIGILNTYAIRKEYDYLYEITGFNITANDSEELQATMSGWAIVNAGMCQDNECLDRYNNPPKLNTKLGSGTGNSTGATTTANKKCQATNTYQYSLTVFGLNDKKQLVDTTKIDNYKPDYNTDLTYSQCPKSSNWKKCSSSYAGACYLNVGFKFNFSLTSLINSGATSLKFQLTIKKNNTVLKTFFVTINKDKIIGSDDDLMLEGNDKISFEVVNSFETVVLTSSRGYPWKTAEYSNNKDSSEHLKAGSKYPYLICNQSIDSKFHLTWYQIAINTRTNNTPATSCNGKNVKKRWVPSAWTAPATGNFEIKIIPPENHSVASCKEESSKQSPIANTIHSCSGDGSFSGNNYSSCTVDTYSYYTKKCYENNYNASLNIGGVDNEITNFGLINGGGFTVTAKLNTTFNCEYTFDVEKFTNDYQNVLSNLNYYASETPDWYLNYNIKNNLDGILKNYLEQTKEINNWESNYDFQKLTAILKVGSDSVNLVYKDSDLVHSTIDLNGDKKKENNSCLVSKSQKMTLNGNNYTIYTNLKCGESWNLTLTLPDTCLNMKTGKAETCNSTSNNQISGGNKYYVDMDSKTGNIELYLEKLGYDGNWSLILKDCSYKVPNLLNKTIQFRQIDLADPFIKKYSPGRGIGKNYLNKNYNFTNIIKSDIWKGEFAYNYLLSKVNVQNIRKDTNEEGVNSYLGRNCYFTSNNKYICEFTRGESENGDNNQKNWFTSIKVND